MIGRWDFSFVPAVIFSILTTLFLQSSSISLSYFILDAPMRECLGKHSSTSSTFPIAILNGTSFFHSLVQEKLNMPSVHYYRLCTWRGRPNHLIKLKDHYLLYDLAQQEQAIHTLGGSVMSRKVIRSRVGIYFYCTCSTAMSSQFLKKKTVHKWLSSMLLRKTSYRIWICEPI